MGDNVTKNSLRQKEQKKSADFETIVKKIVKTEINDFLISEKICVSGILGVKTGSSTTTVQFDHTFPRKPTVTASLAHIYNAGNDVSHTYSNTGVKKVTTESANIYTYTFSSDMYANVAWIACL